MRPKRMWSPSFAIDHFSMPAKPVGNNPELSLCFAIDHFSMPAKHLAGNAKPPTRFAIDHFSMPAKLKPKNTLIFLALPLIIFRCQPNDSLRPLGLSMLCHRSFFDASQTQNPWTVQKPCFAIDHFSMPAKQTRAAITAFARFAIDHFSMPAKLPADAETPDPRFAIDHFSMPAKRSRPCRTPSRGFAIDHFSMPAKRRRRVPA